MTNMLSPLSPSWITRSPASALRSTMAPTSTSRLAWSRVAKRKLCRSTGRILARCASLLGTTGGVNAFALFQSP